MKTISMIFILLGGGVSCTNNLSEVSKKNSSGDASQTTKDLVLDNEDSQEKVAVPTLVAELSIEKVFELQQTGSVLLIDTRSPVFYNLGHIDGAYSLPLKSFKKGFESLRSTLDAAVTEEKKIVVYCQSEKCPDSFKMARALSSAGYNVSIFKGGWELWKMSGL